MSAIINIKRIEESRLYQELKQREDQVGKDFTASIPKLCNHAVQRAKMIIQTFEQYTLHDEVHFLRVTEIMALIIGEDMIKKLSSLEISFLILAAFYHDQGMVVESSEKEKILISEDFLTFKDDWINNSPDYTRISKAIETEMLDDKKSSLQRERDILDKYILVDYVRKIHGKRSKDFVKHLFEEKGELTSPLNIKAYLADLCLSHVESVEWCMKQENLRSNIPIGGNNKCNMLFLCLILRLADILDFDSDRTPDLLLNSIDLSNETSRMEWIKHRSVNGWEISKERLIFNMEFKDPENERFARNFIDWIDKELQDCHNCVSTNLQLFEGYSINIPNKVDRSHLASEGYKYLDLEMSISRDEIINLFMTEELYGHPSFFLRELLQNSLDALRLKKSIYKSSGFIWNEGKMIFRHYIDNNGEEIIECEDNGIGMDERIVTNFLTKLGKSYYRSSEFKRLKRDSKLDFEPCSQFGIGFASCFMVSDRIEIETKRDNGPTREIGKSLSIEINGTNKIIAIRERDKRKESGTIIRVYVRKGKILPGKIDNISLNASIKKFIVFSEFPITIESYNKNETLDYSTIEVETDLESLDIKKIGNISINFNDLDPRLGGIMTQSFLLDENKKYTIVNEEIKFIKNEKQLGSRFKIIKSDNTEENFYNNIYQQTVSIDGILVSGMPLRADKRIPFMSCVIRSEHSFVLNITGSLKPELKPNREPNYKEPDIPPMWKKVQKKVDEASGIIWEKFLNSTTDQEIIWTTFSSYAVNIGNIKRNILREKVSIPIKTGDFIKIDEIESFNFTQENEKKIDWDVFFTDLKGKSHEAFFHGANYLHIEDDNLLAALLLSQSTVSKEGRFLISKNIGDGTLSDSLITMKLNILISDKKLTTIPFKEDELDEKFLFFQHPLFIIGNSNNPVIKAAQNSQDNYQESLIEYFYMQIICEIYDILNEKNIKSIKLEKKHLEEFINNSDSAFLYKEIQWNKQEKCLHPPYKILLKDGEVIEITDAMLRGDNNND